MQIIFFIFIIFLALIIDFKLKEKKGDFEFEKNISKKFSDSIFLEAMNIKSEVEKKGFEILELPLYKKIEFFQNIETKLGKIKYFIYFLFFSIFYFMVFYPLIIFIFYKILGNDSLILLFIIFFGIFYYFYLLYKYKIVVSFIYFLKENSFGNFSGIKSNFLIVFENKVLVDDKKFIINSGDLTTNGKLMDFLQENKSLDYSDFDFIKVEIIMNLVNKKYRFLNNFNRNIKKLDEKIDILENISKDLIKNISENMEFFHKSSEILKNFKILDKKILEIFNLKKNILENFEKITNDKNLDLKKFDFYVLKKVLNPILKLKNILQKNIENIEKMLLESKIEENHQIKFAEKRLEITKDNLQKQIIFLDEKLKFFEK